MKSMRKRSASVAIAEHSGAPNVPICVRPEYRIPAGMGPRIGSRDRGTNIRAASARKMSVHRCSSAGCCKPVRAPSESLPLRHSARPDRRALRPHRLPRAAATACAAVSQFDFRAVFEPASASSGRGRLECPGEAAPHLLLLSAPRRQGKTDRFMRLTQVLDRWAFPNC